MTFLLSLGRLTRYATQFCVSSPTLRLAWSNASSHDNATSLTRVDRVMTTQGTDSRGPPTTFGTRWQARPLVQQRVALTRLIAVGLKWWWLPRVGSPIHPTLTLVTPGGRLPAALTSDSSEGHLPACLRWIPLSWHFLHTSLLFDLFTSGSLVLTLDSAFPLGGERRSGFYLTLSAKRTLLTT